MPVTTSPSEPGVLRLYTGSGNELLSWHNDGSFRPMLSVTFESDFAQFALPASPCRVIVQTATGMVVSCSIYPPATGTCHRRIFQTDKIRYYSTTYQKGFHSTSGLTRYLGIRSNGRDGNRFYSTACGLSFSSIPNLRQHNNVYHIWSCSKKLALERLLMIVIDCLSQTDVPFMPRAKRVYQRS